MVTMTQDICWKMNIHRMQKLSCLLSSVYQSKLNANILQEIVFEDVTMTRFIYLEKKCPKSTYLINYFIFIFLCIGIQKVYKKSYEEKLSVFKFCVIMTYQQIVHFLHFLTFFAIFDDLQSQYNCF